MALLPAYAIDGGTLPAEMLRMVAYNLSSGANGVAAPSDLKVTPLPTPGGGVHIAPGGALLKTRFTNANAQQSYAAMNDSVETLNIPATGSGNGRTDYVILRINDPDYSGQIPENPLAAEYCSFERVASISNLSFPFVPLARITLPASTGTVSAQHITDLREVAIPRRETETVSYEVQYPDAMDIPADGAYRTLGQVPVKIPEWATHAHIMAHFGGLLLARDGRMDGAVSPALAGRGDTYLRTRTEAETKQRTSYPAGGKIPIAANYRGSTTPFYWRAMTANGPGTTYVDGNTTLLATIEFTQEAD